MQGLRVHGLPERHHEKALDYLLRMRCRCVHYVWEQPRGWHVVLARCISRSLSAAQCTLGVSRPLQHTRTDMADMLSELDC
jgi:hypothetical protein